MQADNLLKDFKDDALSSQDKMQMELEQHLKDDEH